MISIIRNVIQRDRLYLDNDHTLNNNNNNNNNKSKKLQNYRQSISMQVRFILYDWIIKEHKRVRNRNRKDKKTSHPHLLQAQ